MADRYSNEAARLDQEPDTSPGATWRALYCTEQAELLDMGRRNGEKRGPALRFGKPARAGLERAGLIVLTRPGRGGRTGSVSWHLLPEGWAVLCAAWCPRFIDRDPPGFDPSTEGP